MKIIFNYSFHLKTKLNSNLKINNFLLNFIILKKNYLYKKNQQKKNYLYLKTIYWSKPNIQTS